MKISKKDLLSALDKTIPFTSKDLNILETVLIDGENGVIVATNLDARAEVSVPMSDQVRLIELPRPEVVFPDENFIVELNELKKDHLVALAEYAGTSPEGKKADLVDAIFQASKAAAEKEAAEPPETKKVMERFCVDPRMLKKIVKSLESEQVDLAVQEYSTSSLFDSIVATALSVGGHFQSLPIHHQPEDFPVLPDDAVPGAEIMAITGNDAARVLQAQSSDRDERQEFKKSMLVDHENKNIVCCDGNRVHWASVEVNTDKSFMVSAPAMSSLAGMVKKEKMTFSRAGDDYIAVKQGGITVYFKASDPEFPQYMDIVNKERPTTVRVKVADFRNLLQQAGAITTESVIFNFNGGICANANDPEKGEYDRQNIPFSKGKVDPPIEMAMRLQYLREAIFGMDKDHDVFISLSELDEDGEYASPVLFSDQKNNALVMPMRI